MFPDRRDPRRVVLTLVIVALIPAAYAFTAGPIVGGAHSAPSHRATGPAASALTSPGGSTVSAAPLAPAVTARPAYSPFWTNVTPTTASPPPRVSGSMAYDSEDGYVLLFGGEELIDLAYHVYNDTWSYVHGAWTNRTSTVAPPARFGAMMADDPADGVVVLFGGEGPHEGQLFNDTWEYAAGVWTNVTSTIAPPARFWASMSYDSQTDSVLLFGGNEGPTFTKEYSNDTWSFHAGVWTELFPTTNATGRDDQAQVDDVSDAVVLMFGGLDGIGYLNDTWEYSSGSWTPLSVSSAPDQRAGAGMAYDSTEGVVVLYGGYPAETDYYLTWIFHAGVWTNYSLTPTPPAGTTWGQMADDPADGVVILFQGNGAFNSTWSLGISSGPPPISATLAAEPDTVEIGGSTTFVTSVTGQTNVLTYAYSTLPPGCLSVNESMLPCSPTKAGTYYVGVNVTQAGGGSASAVGMLVVVKPSPPPQTLLVGLTATPSNITLGSSTKVATSVTGGAPPYTYVYSGLPTGCASQNLSSFSCTPTVVEHYIFSVNVTDVASDHGIGVTVLNVTAAASSPSSSGISDWIWVLVAVVVAAAIILLALVFRRKSRPLPPAPVAGTPPPSGPPTRTPPRPPGYIPPP